MIATITNTPINDAASASTTSRRIRNSSSNCNLSVYTNPKQSDVSNIITNTTTAPTTIGTDALHYDY